MTSDARLYEIYRESVDALQATGIRFLVGGGTAVAAYGRARYTKDFDLFLNRDELTRAMAALNANGFFTSDTEKPWLYKAQRLPAQIDLIIRSAGSYTIDDETMRRVRQVMVGGQVFPLMAPEDLLARKISSFMEGRPDWYDALSVLRAQAGHLDWAYLLHRTERHPERLLSFLLFAIGDLPGGRELIPSWVLGRLMAATRRRLRVTQEPLGPAGSPYPPARRALAPPARPRPKAA